MNKHPGGMPRLTAVDIPGGQVQSLPINFLCIKFNYLDFSYRSVGDRELFNQEKAFFVVKSSN
jgi:hypothetical protein